MDEIDWLNAVPLDDAKRKRQVQEVLAALEKQANGSDYSILCGDTLTVGHKLSDGRIEISDCKMRKMFVVRPGR